MNECRERGQRLKKIVTNNKSKRMYEKRLNNQRADTGKKEKEN